ncbi:response regulator [Candidatus Woesearchaeota archaeon]|nr:response regulator [Candidatus Woesearchaeota archaeon]
MGLKILIVDDSAFMRNVIKNALNGLNVSEIFEAGTADESINLYTNKKPDMVFMDIIMPGKTGLDALRAIKGLDSNAKVVMCTSVGQEKIVQEAITAGAYDFITKPFKSEEIVEVVSKVDSKNQQGLPAAQPSQPVQSQQPVQPQSPPPPQQAPPANTPQQPPTGQQQQPAQPAQPQNPQQPTQ